MMRKGFVNDLEKLLQELEQENLQEWAEAGGVNVHDLPADIPRSTVVAKIRAALEGNPDPCTKELEAEVARLRDALELAAAWLETAAKLQKHGHEPGARTLFNQANIAKAALTPDADAKGGEGE